MLKEIFEKGMTFNEFSSLDDSKHKTEMIEYSNIGNIDKILKNEIVELNKNIKILLFGEIACPDCVINSSAIEKMCLLNCKIEYKIVRRDGYEDIIKKYGDQEKAYIPTVIVMDEEYNMIGTFVERPIIIKELANETDQVKRILTMKEYKKGKYVDETIKDILKIIQKNIIV